MSHAHNAQPSAILTIEAASPGGVPALVDVVGRLMRKWGYAPTVYRAEFATGDLTLLERLAITVRRWIPRLVDERGLPTVLVPAPPLPLWLFYVVPHFLFGRLLGQHRAIFVVSGSAHVALPLALRGIPYILWIATTYQDELEAKAAAGDHWAERVLASPTWRLLDAQERLALRCAHRVLALSYHTAERIKTMTADTVNYVETVLFPIDTTRYRPNPAVRASSPYGEYLLLAARINDPRKNVGLLLEAFAQVHTQLPGLRLMLVGEEPGPLLIDRVAALGLEDAVIFRGIVSADELLLLYQGAQLFVLPSTQEGLGIVVLEAMACGTPVVATRCGGPEGIVIDGETGRLVSDFRDPTPLARAMLDLLSNPDQLEQMRQRCVEFALSHFSFPTVAEQLRAAYEDVRAAPPRPIPLREWLSAIWAALVFVIYMQHQMIIHWPSIQAKLLVPLLNAIR